MKDNNVYIRNTKLFHYDNSSILKPSEFYIEQKNNDLSIKSDKRIYDELRNLFIDMGFDKKNIGTEHWNPFADFIKPGNTVLIKPNLVKHINKLKGGSIDSVITNFSIIRVIIDYTILALKGHGKIIVGDAPVQECLFKDVVNINSLAASIEMYKKNFENIELVDFRKNENPLLECITVTLDEHSSLCEIDNDNPKYAVTNYNLRLMKEHHKFHKHEYIIPKKVLESDVIINLPKPKTHRKAGITASMKNFVGISGNKECIPHHRSGDLTKNGDEFPENNLLKNLHSSLKQQSYKKNILINYCRKFLTLILKKKKLLKFEEGSWYGNDTIWRTILDLNRLILYANKMGKICTTKQRKIFHIGDMIISGEKDGPLLPSSKPVGLLIASFNALNFDSTVCKIMGFDSYKIKYLKNGYDFNKYKISDSDNFNVYDNNGKKVEDVSIYNQHFIPPDGWIEYLVEEEKK